MTDDLTPSQRMGGHYWGRCRKMQGFESRDSGLGSWASEKRRGQEVAPLAPKPESRAPYWTAFTISKIGRYNATTMPPTVTPSTTIRIGSRQGGNGRTRG